MTILVIGASGAIGRPTVRHLVKRGAKIRALSSKESSAANLKSLGVTETVIGDLTNDADVSRAMAGAASVIHIPPRFREDEAEIGQRVLKAAVEAKVGHFVFSSVFHPQMRDMDHHFNKLVVEEALIDSGLSFTIMQPAMFMQSGASRYAPRSARSTNGSHGPRRRTGARGRSKPMRRCAGTTTSTAMPAAIRWCSRRSSAARPAAIALLLSAFLRSRRLSQKAG
jgi:uncharacterized protein YbjT (DUF2867 family)